MTVLAPGSAEVIHRIQSETRRDRDYARGAGKNHAMNTASVPTLLNTARRTG